MKHKNRWGGSAAAYYITYLMMLREQGSGLMRMIEELLEGASPCWVRRHGTPDFFAKLKKRASVTVCAKLPAVRRGEGGKLRGTKFRRTALSPRKVHPPTLGERPDRGRQRFSGLTGARLAFWASCRQSVAGLDLLRRACLLSSCF